MSRNKIGRNDPCFCGSGRKYKKCHLIKRREIEDEIRRGAVYVAGPGEFGVVKISEPKNG